MKVIPRRAFGAGLLAAGLAPKAARAAGAIDEGLFVDIRGARQWVRIRGEDAGNPVLLYLHGGPGAASSMFTWSYLARLGWEKAFTVVHWDQPGSGRSFIEAGKRIDPNLTVEQIAQDGLAIAEAVSRKLGQRRILLFGGSWGAAVGLLMANARPQLFRAYVGSAQVVDRIKSEALAYDRVLAKARARGIGAAVDELTKAGPPPYATPLAFQTQRKWAGAFEIPGPVVSQPEMIQLAAVSQAETADWLAGMNATDTHFRGAKLDGPWQRFDAHKIGRRFELPMIFLQGEEDDITPARLVKDYAGWIRAPRKVYVSLPGAGHNVHARAPEFLPLMIEKVTAFGA